MNSTINNSNHDKNVIETFIKFMESHKLNKSNEEDKEKIKTHTSMGVMNNSIYKGTFSIDDSEYDDFIKLYNSVLGKIDLYLVERHDNKSVGPLVIDIDFKVSDKWKERQYSYDHIELIIEIYNEVIKKYLDIENDKIKAYVFEKPEPTLEKKNNVFKDGFHILYPELSLGIKTRYLIFDETKNIMIKEEIFSNIPIINSYDEIIDESVITRNGLLMYGSHKEGRKPYELKKIYNHDLTTDDLDNFLNSNIDFVKYFSVRRYSDNDRISYKTEYVEEVIELENKIYEKYLPKKKKDKHNIDNFLDRYQNNNNSLNKKYNKEIPEEEYKFIEGLVELLSDDRAEEYSKWISVCWALHSVSDSIYDIFDKFSRRSNKYDADSCKKFWNSYDETKNGYTIASLHWWAKKDNNKKYNDLMQDKLKNECEKAMSGTHEDLSRVICEMYKYEFKCVDLVRSGGRWYEFIGHRWVEVAGGYSLRNKIADEFSKRFSSLHSYYMLVRGQAVGMEHDDTQRRISKVHEIVKKLGSEDFLSNVMKACARKMYDKSFFDKLDSNPDLLGFENGVYDLKNRVFRAAIPEDYISLSVGYNYQEFSKNDNMIKDIIKYFEQVQYEDDMREYVLRFCSSLLDGHVRDQKFIMWTGNGANGKSTTVDLIHMTLGDYAANLNSRVLTQKNTSAYGATPDLADKKGKRFLCIQETEREDKINVGLMKELTAGNDKITARALYSDPITYIPTFKMALICNVLPDIPSNDGGTWRRLRVTEWPAKFVENPKERHEFKLDPTIPNKMKSWKAGFMWLLLNCYYPKYISEGLKEPPKVMEFTNKYQQNNDVFYEYIVDILEETNNTEDSLKLTDIYSIFKGWYRDSHTGKPPEKKELKEYFEKKYGKRYKPNNTIIGIKFNQC